MSRMLVPSRKARRISPYWNTVSILCLRFQYCPGDGPYWNGDGWGGSRLDADFKAGGGSLLRADYHLGLVGPSLARQLTRLPAGNQGALLAVTRRRTLTAPKVNNLIHFPP